MVEKKPKLTFGYALYASLSVTVVLHSEIRLFIGLKLPVKGLHHHH